MEGYITRSVEVCRYENVHISMKEIIEEVSEKDAKELLIGLIKKFPNLVNLIMSKTKESLKLFPEALKDQLIDKFKKENKSLKNYF